MIGAYASIMPDLVSSLGNPAEWTGDLMALGALLQSIRAGRRGRAAAFAEQLERLTGYTGEQIGEILGKFEDLQELVASALDTAGRSVDERKRALLARAAASGIVGDESVLVDDRTLFIHTLDEVDVPHMKLLVLIGHGRRVVQGLEVVGGWDHETIIRSWPGVRDVLEPLISTLQGAGLIHDTGSTSFDGFANPQWNVTSYGQRFANFVVAGTPAIVPETQCWPIVMREGKVEGATEPAD